jgi:threonylcarbamoyladenosine tRNA methylthiotransferase MtaB
MCSFCLIPFARGHERSRLPEDVIREAKILVAGGYREIVLTGVNIGQYRQGGLDLVGLIEKLEAIEELERIRISSIEPTTITNALLVRMASSSKLCPYLHIPLQSGADSILSAMNRPYDVKEFVHLIDRAMAAIPHLGLGTDIMVGFPGETEKAFEQTLDIARKLPFCYFHVFTYSQRPGTAAAKLPNPVPIAIARKRSKILAELSSLKRLAFAKRYIGSTVSVLFESGEMDGLRLGVTANFLKVGVPSQIELTNHLREVRVIGTSDRWALGELTAEHQPMRRMPVL